MAPDRDVSSRRRPAADHSANLRPGVSAPSGRDCSPPGARPIPGDRKSTQCLTCQSFSENKLSQHTFFERTHGTDSARYLIVFSRHYPRVSTDITHTPGRLMSPHQEPPPLRAISPVAQPSLLHHPG